MDLVYEDGDNDHDNDADNGKHPKHTGTLSEFHRLVSPPTLPPPA